MGWPVRGSARWWVGVGALAIGAGLVAFFAITVTQDDDGGSSAIAVETVEPGTPGRPAALWLLGEGSLRFDPRTLRNGQLLRRRGFGAVLGATARVDLFDPGSGRVGYLDARRNELVDLGTVPMEPESDYGGDPVIADTGDALWLVTGERTVTRFIPTDRRSIPIPLPAPPSSTTTRVAADATAVYAVTGPARGTGGTVHRIDPATDTVVASGALPSTVGSTPVRVRSVSATDRGLWVLGRDVAVRLDRTTLQVRSTVVYRDQALSLYEAAVVGGDIWGLDQTSSELVKIDGDGRTLRRFETRPGTGTLPLPAGLVADDSSVWVLAPVAAETGFGSERLTRVDVRRSTITGRFESPAHLSIGAIAVSRR
jgi:hypothetical protein